MSAGRKMRSARIETARPEPRTPSNASACSTICSSSKAVRNPPRPASDRPSARGVASALLVAASVLCGACAAQQQASVPRQISVPTIADLTAKLHQLDTALASFQGQGKLEYEGPDGKIRSASMVVVKAPLKVRIDFRSPFSITYTVVSDGSELLAYDRGEKVLYRGRPTPENFGRYTHVQVDLGMLASLLRGLPPMPQTNGGSIGRVPEGWRWETPIEDGAR